MSRRLRFLVVASVLGGARVAAAQTYVEAETVRDFGRVQPPFEIHDLTTASGSSYVEVAPGNDSKNAAPTEGIARYLVFVPTGTYRIWARVIAPDDGADSFWVRVDGGPWIKWNEIPLGSNWHWAVVKPEGSNQASTFSLTSDVSEDHTVEFAYREDGTRLDRFVLTTDPNFNPGALPSGAPATPAAPIVAPGRGVARVNIPDVPGATSYTILREGSVLATGVTAHHYTDTNAGFSGPCYSVKAVNASGSSAESEFSCGGSTDVFERDWFADQLPLTAPMLIDPASARIRVQNGLNALTAPAATGRAVMHLQAPVTTQVNVWAAVTAPDVNSDSFWVRLDNGAWIRWNDLTPLPGCARDWDIVNDDLNNNTPVVFTLSPGTHTLQFAYREDGAQFGRVIVKDDLNDPPRLFRLTAGPAPPWSSEESGRPGFAFASSRLG